MNFTDVLWSTIRVNNGLIQMDDDSCVASQVRSQRVIDVTKKERADYIRLKWHFSGEIYISVSIYRLVYCILRLWVMAMHLYTLRVDKKLEHFEMWYYRQILRISWVGWVTYYVVLVRVWEKRTLMKAVYKRSDTLIGDEELLNYK